MFNNKLIEKYYNFYHIALQSSKDIILTMGLIPYFVPEEDFHPDCPNKRNQICLTTKKFLNTMIANLKDKYDNQPLIIFEFSSEVISTKQIGLDWTFSGTEKLKLDSIENICYSIDNYGTIACFERILPEEIIIFKENV
ncbi:MAG: hypothetical protein ACOYMA_14615 [Bacteroidia bacterium]